MINNIFKASKEFHDKLIRAYPILAKDNESFEGFRDRMLEEARELSHSSQSHIENKMDIKQLELAHTNIKDLIEGEDKN